MPTDIETTVTNEIVKATPQKVYFRIVEGSNYKLITSFQDEYIIEYGLFQKLAKAILNKDIEFVTVYEALINKRYIYLLEPTKDKTIDQRKRIEKRKDEAAKREARRREISEQKRRSDVEYYNEKYGVDNWSLLQIMVDQRGNQIAKKHRITAQDMKEATDYFRKKYPNLFYEW